MRAQRHDLPLYALLGPGLATLVRSVIADEARHDAALLAVAQGRHAELPGALARIRAQEGQPYAANFLLDRAALVFRARLLTSAERTLLDHVLAP